MADPKATADDKDPYASPESATHPVAVFDNRGTAPCDDADRLRLAARLAVLAAAVLWSTSGFFAKLPLFDVWTADSRGVQIAFWRALFAAILILPFVRRTSWRWSMLPMAISFGGMSGLYLTAMSLTTAANAIFIQSTAPLWVVLLSARLLDERPSRAELGTIPIYGVGLLCFFLDELSPGQRAGNWVALGAGLAFALCIIGLRKIRERGPSALVYGNWLAALLTLPGWLHEPVPGLIDTLVLVYLGVFQLGLSYLCFTRGVAHTPALEAALLVLLEPVLNPIWTFFIIGEQPGPWAITGGSIVLSATIWRTLSPLWAKAH